MVAKSLDGRPRGRGQTIAQTMPNARRQRLLGWFRKLTGIGLGTRKYTFGTRLSGLAPEVDMQSVLL